MESTNPSNNSGLKVVIGILALLLTGSLGYVYKLTTEVKLAKNTIVTVTDEKGKVMADLAALNATYTAAIAENTSLSDELVVERDKVIKLIEDLKRSNGSVASLSGFKQKYLALDGKMKSLMTQVDDLTNKNSKLTVQRDSTVTVLGESRKSNETLVGQNQELASTIEKGSKLTLLNLKTNAFKVKGSGKQVETDKASRADMLRISFTIAENRIAKVEEKNYYVQVIDADNNVLGEKQTVNFEAKTLTYSFIANVKYSNKTVDITHDLPGKDFPKGNYFVNVFDKNELVSNSSFNLK